MMPMAPSARLAFRLVGAVGTSTTFCDNSACMLATCTTMSLSHDYAKCSSSRLSVLPLLR